MFKTLTLVSALAVLGGCATCQNHPYVCAVGGAVIVGSVAATVAAREGHDNRQAAPEKATIHPWTW